MSLLWGFYHLVTIILAIFFSQPFFSKRGVVAKFFVLPFGNFSPKKKVATRQQANKQVAKVTQPP
jgi:hypothetical protein